ncbi:MAG: hypothetical protein KAT17_06650, partial [Candidatus Aminicenantes bacterium]|nr:hypothetical protein [Candidatus Aminicenantes bacterium]
LALFYLFLLSGILFPVNSDIDKASLPFLKWMGPGKPGTYQEYLRKKVDRPYFIKEIVSFPSQSRNDQIPAPEERKIMILVNSQTFQNLSGRILRYSGDLNNQGYTVEVFEYSGGNPANLKSFIVSRNQNLRGCVFIGNLPVAWYEVEDDYFEYGYAEFPCDLYYMDLDGKWQDMDGNGQYDSHQDGSGDRQPEIFIGRIDASGMEGDEIEILNNYFDKNHEFWSGNLFVHQYGLTYTEDDWSIYSDMVNDITHLYPGRYEAITAPDTDRNDYLENRLQNVKYEFIQLACHSSSTAHYFVRNGLLYSNEIKNAPPQGLAYNLFCCSALRFTDYNCLGKSYVFNQGRKALTVVGSTKTGSMLEFGYFYQSLGLGNPVGGALKEWFNQIAPYDPYDLFWHYGMTILGDPLMVMMSGEKDIYPPLNLNGSLEENFSFFLTEYINVLTWDPNPLNDGIAIVGYRIYLIEQDGVSLIQDLDLNANEFLHRFVDKSKKYVYGLVSFKTNGDESWPAIVEVGERH